MKECGKVEVYLHLFFSFVLDELEWSDSRYGPLYPRGNGFLYPLKTQGKNTD
jgi:hypothetical protein